ncbi:putative spermidine/putrescine transport system permease protein [Cupriavidus gilardii J11]|uniref:Putative spermidine/putrescine transport system permease protein n=1 Tax=Cupriavidus gilardii J11 TaxID=936133 RepID=A0A562B884_9BURK|nr:ABC transporter permease [Cupriavidus gilardii]TWG81248.1 putative spermidine/putrescine transport system permease protein [Cupriavidus gilardii J11]
MSKASTVALWTFCAAVLIFLLAPIVAIVPLSFNAEPYLNYPMAGWSLQWYREFFGSASWQLAWKNSVVVASCSALASGVLGTLAALGLHRRDCPMRGGLLAVLISPVVVPIVITGVGCYIAFAQLGLLNSLAGLIVAHTGLGAPFVVITVMAALSRFDARLTRAAASLGAGPATTFFRVTLPLIAPGVASGMLFAFVTSFDEVVIALFIGGPEQRTLPRQMWTGVRESISPTIAAAATVLIVLSVTLLAVVQSLRERMEAQARSGSPLPKRSPKRSR